MPGKFQQTDPMAGTGVQDRKQVVSIDGHRLTLTNLDKVLYPATGTTKGEVLAYLATVAPVLLPFARDRPATRKRWVHGVGTGQEPGQVFFQKNLEKHAPSWVHSYVLQHKDHVNTYPVINDAASLAWLGQNAALELHVPQWRFSAEGLQLNPDRLVLDLDPGEGAGLPECAEVARLARAILTDMGLTPHPVTSGSKGIHLYAHLDGSQTSDQVSAVAHELARALESDYPDLIVSDMKKVLRAGKVLLDWSQNNAAKTTICPYSLRGKLRPWVAAPRTWEELEDPGLAQLDYLQVLDRVAAGLTPAADLVPPGGASGGASGGTSGETPGGNRKSHGSPQPRAEAGDAEPADRLRTYRSMRDPDRTPEPVPAGVAPVSEGRSFVIQEHHARRLHYDFRLERDGVLVSWAVPKGVPETPRQNHLAVQTEDHPLEYASFSGSIPKGEYGGGEVTIWDSGTYDLEKWRDGKEVIVTLHGTRDGGLGGPRRVALIHTGGADPKAEKNWLMHLMKDQQPHSWDEAGSAPQPARAAAEDPEVSGPAPETASASDMPEESGPALALAPAAAPVNAAAPAPGLVAADYIEPMLASIGTAGDVGDGNWDFEMKWDGMRAVAVLSGDTLRLLSRNGNDITAGYPDLRTLPPLARSAGADSAVFDGEIVALNKSGRPDFRLLQSRMKLTRPADIERAVRNVPVAYMIFDLLQLNGMSLVDEPFRSRRQVLDMLLAAATSAHPDANVQLSPLLEGSIEDAVATSQALELEGIMAKESSSTYLPGRRSRSWLKIKNSRTQDVVVAGWRTGNGNRAATIGSLLLGVPVEGELRYVGRVGTGFSDADLTGMAARFRRMARTTSPLAGVPRADAADAHWITPSLVGEVSYAEKTGDGRLRHPVWRGWRPDKQPDQVIPEDPV
ncbi:MAG: ATP-dependent ligase [Micrococcaceae bacterium]|nr:ATP-dependent ligase [Micrococcaceae bacterium]